MHNNKMRRAAALLAVMVLATTVFTGGTLAKYTTEKSSTASSAKVAKWLIKVNGADITDASVQNITFNLFNTIKEADTTTVESDVASGLIAPGTGGQADIAVKNESEVNAKYTVKFAYTVTGGNVPIEVSTDNSTWKTLDTSAGTTVSDVALAMNATSTTTLYWRWQYERDADADDTALGIAAKTAAPQVSVTATVTATQVD